MARYIKCWRFLFVPASVWTDDKRQWVDGVFQFMKDADGVINHRYFQMRAPDFLRR